jgi:uncharacterized protein with GYD domain
MPTYISLVSWTDQGIRNVKEAPKRLDSFRKVVEAAGGEVKGYYLTMGKYDSVLIIEFPSDKAAAAMVLGGGSQGNVRTETMKAFPEDEFRDIISKIQ